jgi:hypothetical protein
VRAAVRAGYAERTGRLPERLTAVERRGTGVPGKNPPPLPCGGTWATHGTVLPGFPAGAAVISFATRGNASGSFLGSDSANRLILLAPPAGFENRHFWWLRGALVARMLQSVSVACPGLAARPTPSGYFAAVASASACYDTRSTAGGPSDRATLPLGASAHICCTGGTRCSSTEQGPGVLARPGVGIAI